MLDYKKSIISPNHDWIVFLHGFGGNHTIFYKQIEQYEKNYNLLFIDLPGHGTSTALATLDHTVEKITKEIIKVIDELAIVEFHIVGFSLGTIFAQEMIAEAQDRIKSVVLAGAVIKWNWWSKLLVKTSYQVRFLAPYMIFYKIFALLMMPRENHSRSRNIFIKEATKLGRAEFMKWAKLAIKPELAYQNATKISNSIPKLYVLGRDDHMFIQSAAHAASIDSYAELEIIEEAGHVCIIEKAIEFNRVSLKFLKQHQSESNDWGIKREIG
ncbi:alpha/beta fold hydrolase [Halalkalibacter akibai]|uniref:Beta-ketoadipate enol-lactone hydrolase n=1 Tax=Halalkalibacter akibai (strain ATCC 43226 / DSM 21942 / CIP 109018 / JCM 9157 / 1139) TaxID=1236973 RepID=W4QV14_HALA3|nr:alpha/beta hydrolase [Halalkalibacter akibai]GAE35772.1 beta-ketoadipate enol-lactone hydrolase [Halalkalibacter akibai JCM 9157]